MLTSLLRFDQSTSVDFSVDHRTSVEPELISGPFSLGSTSLGLLLLLGYFDRDFGPISVATSGF